MTGSLEGRVALVTGAGGGIGRAIALELAARGAIVAVHYRRNREGAEAICRQLTAGGAQASAFAADVTDPAEVRQVVARVEDAYDRIDVLVNNAGDLVERRTVAQMDAALFRQILDVNLTGTLLVLQAVADGMRRRNAGSIVNMSSVAAHTGGGPGAYAYAAAKAAVIALTKGIAKELAPNGIRVNCVSPGLIGGTEFHERFTTPDAFAATEKTIPLGRAGAPADVARVVAFLAGDDAAYLTGETIEINGGMYMR